MNDMRNNKFESNKKYFTICVYAIVVILIGTCIIKGIMDWEKTMMGFHTFNRVMSPFFIGALIAYMINPFMKKVYMLLKRIFKNRFERVSRFLAILISYAIVIGLIVIVLLYIVPQLVRSISDLVLLIPEWYVNTVSYLSNFETVYPELDFEYINTFLENMGPELILTAKNFASNILPMLYATSMSIIKWMTNLLIAIIVSAYMLSEKNNLRINFKKFVFALFPMNRASYILQTLSECEHIFSKFIIGKSIDSLIIGLLCFLFMNILNLPFSLLISVIVGVTNMIPYFGPFIGAVPGALLTLIISPANCLVFLILILILQQFDGLILGPKILGDSTGLKPLWIICAITIGGNLAGVLGMFLGVPVAGILNFLTGRWIDRRLQERNITSINEPKEDAAD